MLLKNDNRKFIKTLSNNCLKANHTRNRIALLAIILTAVLFTTITTVFQGAQVTMKDQKLRTSGSKFMASIKYPAPEKVDGFLKDKAFTKVGAERALGLAQNEELKRIMASVTWMDETYAEGSYSVPEKGRMPEKEDEIACDSVVLELLGLPYETGTKLKLKYQVDGENREKEMTVCGIWKGRELEQNTNILVSETFVENNIEESKVTEGASVSGSYTIRGSFSDENNIEEMLNQVLEHAGYDPSAERGEAGFIIHHVNPAYHTSEDMGAGTIAAIAAGVILVLLAGYLIIYNIFRISVIKDIRLYGQLKTIGTSPGQIQYMVRRQGMCLSLTGVPAGIVLGWLLGNALLPLVMSTSNYSDTSFIWPNPFVWAFSAAFTVLTVWISCRRPGKTAGKISPVEALRYQEQEEGKKKQRKGKESRNRLLQMAFANLSRNKGKTILVVLSISLSIILLNSVLNAVGCFDKETYVEQRTISDFNVMNTQMERYTGEEIDNIVSAEFAGQLEALPGVVDFSKTYCNEVPSEEIKTGTEGLARVDTLNGKQLPSDTKNGIEPYRMVMGMNENALKRCKLIEGELDYEKLRTGDYIITIGYLGDYGEFGYDRQEFHAGDTIEAEVNGISKTYQIMAVVGASHSMLPDHSMGGYEMIGLAENVFLEYFPDNRGPIRCLFDAEKGSFDSLNEYLAAQEDTQNIKTYTRLSMEAYFDEMMLSYTGVGVVLSLVFGIIGILNLLNVILTGAIARQGEFATMRSIGMTRKQLRRLFMAEGIFYAVFAGGAGILLSAVLSLTMVRGIMGAFWFAKYHFTIGPALLAAAACLIISSGIAYVIDLMWNKGSIVEKLRKVE